MKNDALPNRSLQRQLMLRDSLVFLGLTLITLLLFVATLLLFRSFSSHREELGRRWYARGQRDLVTSQAKNAVFDLRTAVSYDPGDNDYQFLLAQALEQAGSTEEAYTYFSELREENPGSGPLNLELARLSAQKKVLAEALHYYRAAIYGSWDKEPERNRRAARLELVHHLLSTGDPSTARTELLIASEDSDADPSSQAEIATLMINAGDNASALSLFQKILAHNRRDRVALQGAGNAAFNLNRYTSARRYLSLAASYTDPGQPSDLPLQSRQHLAQAIRILELYPSPDLPKSERAARIESLIPLVRSQLTDCRLETAGKEDATGLTTLDEAWKANEKKFPTSRLRRDPSLQEAEFQFLNSTWEQVDKTCQPTTADSRLLQKIFSNQDTILE